MKSILTKLTMGLLCATLAASPASAAIERKTKQATETTTTTHAVAAAGTKATYGTSLSRAEKRQARKALINALRNTKDDTSKILQVILCFFIPPLAVYLHEGEINSKFWISLVLTLLFFFPGFIYSLLVVLDVI